MALLSSEPTWHTFPLSSNASCRASELLNSLGLASPKLSSFHLSHFKMGSSFLTSPQFPACFLTQPATLLFLPLQHTAQPALSLPVPGSTRLGLTAPATVEGRRLNQCCVAQPAMRHGIPGIAANSTWTQSPGREWRRGPHVAQQPPLQHGKGPGRSCQARCPACVGTVPGTPPFSFQCFPRGSSFRPPLLRIKGNRQPTLWLPLANSVPATPQQAGPWKYFEILVRKNST